MSQPALLVPPDDRAARLFPGEITSMGAIGQSPVLWLYPSSNPFGRTDGADLTTLLPTIGSEWDFNGILMLPTTSEYLLPSRVVGRERKTRSGIFIPKLRLNWEDWYLGRAQGVPTYTDDLGNFTESFRIQIFDAKSTFRCLMRRRLLETDDVEATLSELRDTATEADRIRIFGIHGLEAFMMEVELGKREYPPPPKPYVETVDDGEPKRKPRTRKAARTDD